MAVAKPQLGLVGLKTQAEADAEAAEKAARRERRGILRHRCMAALREFARQQQLNACAMELDADDTVFGGGKGVSPSSLRACLEGVERNYFRFDWIFWFAEECDEFADLLMEVAGHKSEKTPEQELEDLKNAIRTEYPKQAASLIRKGQLPRSSR